MLTILGEIFIGFVLIVLGGLLIRDLIIKDKNDKDERETEC